MSQKDINAHTTGRVKEYRDFILKHLQEQGAITVANLESLIFQQFSPQFTDEDKSWVHHLKSQKKTVEKWRNDIHWARAGLTRSGVTMTLPVGKEEWLAYRTQVQGVVFGKALVLSIDADAEIAKHVGRIARLIQDATKVS